MRDMAHGHFILIMPFLTDPGHAHYQNLFRSCLSWVLCLQEKCSTVLNISTCPSCKTTCQGNRTSGIFLPSDSNLDPMAVCTWFVGIGLATWLRWFL